MVPHVSLVLVLELANVLLVKLVLTCQLANVQIAQLDNTQLTAETNALLVRIMDVQFALVLELESVLHA